MGSALSRGKHTEQVETLRFSAVLFRLCNMYFGEIILSPFFGPTDVQAPITGRIVAIAAKQGDTVEKGEILAFIE